MSNKKEKTDRMQQLQNNPPKVNAVNSKETAPAAPVREKASKEEYLAVQLHQARATSKLLREMMAQKEEHVAALTGQTANLRKQVLALENIIEEKENADLRKSYGLVEGRTIRRDEGTGDVWWETT